MPIIKLQEEIIPHTYTMGFFVVMEKLQSTLAEETFFFFTDVLKTFFLDNTLPT